MAFFTGNPLTAEACQGQNNQFKIMGCHERAHGFLVQCFTDSDISDFQPLLPA